MLGIIMEIRSPFVRFKLFLIKDARFSEYEKSSKKEIDLPKLVKAFLFLNFLQVLSNKSTREENSSNEISGDTPFG